MNIQKFKTIGINIFLMFTTFIICFLFLEFVVFHFISPVSEHPMNYFANGVIKYTPNQTGTKFIEDSKVKYNINAQGWNSKYQEYVIKRNDKFRIAIIGDSYVEGFQINFDHSLAEQLEGLLGEKDVEVYRFGVSGAALSQYLLILREAFIRYNPDLVVILAVHNDFMESYEMLPGRFSSSFLKLNIEEGKDIQEIAPLGYEERLWETMSRKSATLRFFRFHPRLQLKNIFGRFLLDKASQAKVANFQANIDISALKEKKQNNIKAVDYVLQEFSRLRDSNHFKILILMDGDRQNIYLGNNAKELYEDGALSLNLLIAAATNKWGIPFIDLHPIFVKDYKMHNKKFEFMNDNHWNERGHRIAAQTIYQYIMENNLLADRKDKKITP